MLFLTVQQSENVVRFWAFPITVDYGNSQMITLKGRCLPASVGVGPEGIGSLGKISIRDSGESSRL